MNINDISVFLCVAKEKSISKASKYLYMTPQGISKVVKNLEKECDAPLFDRSSGKLELTDSGEVFLEFSKASAQSYGDMKSKLKRIRLAKEGEIDLLSAYGILRLVTPECIIDFKKKYPDIIFNYREYPDLQVERLFDSNEGNIAFSIGDFEPDKYNVTEMESFPIALLVNEDHPLCCQNTVTIDCLRGLPLFIETNQFKIHNLIVEKCRKAGFEPNIVFETSGFSLCHKMVKDGKGVSVTVDFIFDDMKSKGLVKIPFSDGKYEWKICMLTRKNEIFSPAMELFYRHVLDWMEKIHRGEIKR